MINYQIRESHSAISVNLAKSLFHYEINFVDFSLDKKSEGFRAILFLPGQRIGPSSVSYYLKRVSTHPQESTNLLWICNRDWLDLRFWDVIGQHSLLNWEGARVLNCARFELRALPPELKALCYNMTELLITRACARELHIGVTLYNRSINTRMYT